MSNEIWVPKSETTVVVQDGQLYVREEMKMTLRPVQQTKGFESSSNITQHEQTVSPPTCT